MMPSFTATIFAKSSLAHYDIYQKGEKYIAQLLTNTSGSYMPNQIILWKEKGRWTSNHHLHEHVLYQFSFTIENYLLSLTYGAKTA